MHPWRGLLAAGHDGRVPTGATSPRQPLGHSGPRGLAVKRVVIGILSTLALPTPCAALADEEAHDTSERADEAPSVPPARSSGAPSSPVVRLAPLGAYRRILDLSIFAGGLELSIGGESAHHGGY